MGCFPSFHGQTNIANIAKIAHAPVTKTAMGSQQRAPRLAKISEENSSDSMSTGSESFDDNDLESHDQSTGSSDDEGVEQVETIPPPLQRQCRQHMARSKHGIQDAVLARKSCFDNDLESHDQDTGSNGDESVEQIEKIKLPLQREPRRQRMVRSKHRIQDAVLARKNSFEKRQQACEKARLIDRAIQLKKAIKKLELRRGEQFIRRARAGSVGDEATSSAKAQQTEYVNNATKQLKQQLLLLQAETQSMDHCDGIAAESGAAKVVSANLSELFCVEQIVEEYQLGQNRAQSAESYEMLRQRQKSQMRVLKRKTYNFFFTNEKEII